MGNFAPAAAGSPFPAHTTTSPFFLQNCHLPTHEGEREMKGWRQEGRLGNLAREIALQKPRKYRIGEVKGF